MRANSRNQAYNSRRITEDSFTSDEDEKQTFQISVSIGGEKKIIQAFIDSKPYDIASRFIEEHGVDTKLQDTLTKLITDQINKIKQTTAAGPADL